MREPPGVAFDSPDFLLRVAAVVAVTIIVFFAASFVVLFVFFLDWLLSKHEIGNYRLVRRIAAIWMYSAHVQSYATYSYPLANTA